MLFTTYLYYIYQISKDVTNPALLESQQSLLHKIGLAMGAVVGLVYIIIFATAKMKVTKLVFSSVLVCLSLAQLCTIIAKNSS